MNVDDAFESALTVTFARLAEGAPVAVDARAMTAAVASPGEPTRDGRFALGRVRWSVVIAAALLVVATIVGGAVIGSRPPERLETTQVDTPPIERVAYQGVFVPTGPLDTNLAIDAYVRLADGRVLGIGDSWPERKQQSLWDPATGRFSPAGLLVGKRSQPIGVLLEDGRVLILGGDITEPRIVDGGPQGAATYSTAEIYDPTKSTYTAAGPMVGKGWAPSAIRLADGRVLVLDGISVDDALTADPLLATAEIYDPATDTFTATGPMSTNRGAAHMALLDDGRVLLVGGRFPETGSAELFDPDTGRFEPTAPLPDAGPHPAGIGGGRSAGGPWWPEVAAAAVRLPDGRILVPGRHCQEVQSISEGRYPTAAAIYDPATANFSVSTPMPHCVESATPLPDGRVFLTAFWGETNWSGIYDPSTDAVTETAAPPAGRYQEVVGLADGRVLVISGGGAKIFR